VTSKRQKKKKRKKVKDSRRSKINEFQLSDIVPDDSLKKQEVHQNDQEKSHQIRDHYQEEQQKHNMPNTIGRQRINIEYDTSPINFTNTPEDKRRTYVMREIEKMIYSETTELSDNSKVQKLVVASLLFADFIADRYLSDQEKEENTKTIHLSGTLKSATGIKPVHIASWIKDKYPNRTKTTITTGGVRQQMEKIFLLIEKNIVRNSKPLGLLRKWKKDPAIKISPVLWFVSPVLQSMLWETVMHIMDTNEETGLSIDGPLAGQLIEIKTRVDANGGVPVKMVTSEEVLDLSKIETIKTNPQVKTIGKDYGMELLKRLIDIGVKEVTFKFE